MKIINELLVDDINKSINFYKDILGFEVIDTVGEPIEWAKIHYGETELMMELYESAKEEFSSLPSKTFSTNLIMLKYENNEEIDSIYKKVKDNNIRIFNDLKETDYGTKEFVIMDPDSNILIISN